MMAESKRLATLGQPFEQEADAVQRGREGLGIGWALQGRVSLHSQSAYQQHADEGNHRPPYDDASEQIHGTFCLHGFTVLSG